MAAESARSLDSSEQRKDRIDLDGLDGFFSDEHDELYSKGLTLKQAVFYYGDTRKALKTKVTQGLVPAIRLPETHARKWRVFPDGVPEQLAHLIPKKVQKKLQNAEIPQEGALTPDTQSDFQESASVLQESLTVLQQTAAFIDETQIAQDPPAAQIFPEQPLVPIQAIASVQEPTDTEQISTQSEFMAFSQMPLKQADDSFRLENKCTVPDGMSKSEVSPETPEPSASAALIENAVIVDSAPPETTRKTARYSQLQDRITELEKQLADVVYRNNYLETRLTGLEDQIKFLTQSHYQSRNVGKFAMVIPLALLAAILIFRFSGQL